MTKAGRKILLFYLRHVLYWKKYQMPPAKHDAEKGFEKEIQTSWFRRHGRKK
jgi:hypothetical protein